MSAPEYQVNIIGLSLNKHAFDFSLNDAFFSIYGSTLLQGGQFEAIVTLEKRETMIEAEFRVRGHARLECDRTLESFDHPLNLERMIRFKYGEEPAELSDEIVVIGRNQATLDLGQYLYEFITVSLPMKRLHPRFQNEALEESDTRLIYSSAEDQKPDEDVIDPRWEKLKNLK